MGLVHLSGNEGPGDQVEGLGHEGGLPLHVHVHPHPHTHTH